MAVAYELNTLRDWPATNMAVLTDQNTAKHCLPLIQKFLPKDFLHITVPAGETNKNIISAELVWDSLLRHSFDRKSLLVNLGGGMVTDLGGFCAASYQRGIGFINIPTTLMGMVDAAIGGKTGINLGAYKNQIGFFAEAKTTIIDPVFLKTLPERELRSGFAEVIKYSLIARLDIGPWQLGQPETIQDWLPIIKQCVKTKEKIVAQDPKENGLRKVLNFGHTVGHSLESYSLEHGTEPLLHGEAIVYGMIAELHLSHKKTGLSQEPIIEWLQSLLPLAKIAELPDFDPETLLRYMAKDKKNENGEIRFVLLKSPGEPIYDIPCTQAEIKETLDYLKKVAEKK